MTLTEAIAIGSASTATIAVALTFILFTADTHENQQRDQSTQP